MGGESGDGPGDGPGVGLAAAVKALRAELEDAAAEGAGKGVAFEVGPVELEFQVRVTRAGTGGGKVRFWVVDAEVGGSVGREATHRLAVSLRPVARAPDGSVSDLAVGDPVGRRPR